jgi:predicted LPLAT superfamily acyltransferase
VLDKGHNPAMTQLLDALNPEVAAGVIDAGQPGTDLLLAIGDALAKGDIVALLVDRAQPGEPAAEAPFFGTPARFPLAPWQLATLLGVPVVLAFGLYRGGNRYDLRFEPFTAGERIPRPRRHAHVAALILRYAARLEDLARQSPYNWFNFYDYWEGHDAQGDRDGGAAGRDDGERGGLGDCVAGRPGA